MSTIGEGSADAAPTGFVHFFASGDRVKGEYHCSDCGYGVTVYTQLPRCPMCSGESWEQADWSPFSREHLAGGGSMPTTAGGTGFSLSRYVRTPRT